MTEKLYDIDSHLYEFTANALSVEKRNDFYLTVLDRTAFFPEGGGQASDIGCINGVFVDYVFIENDIIYHRTKEPIALGEVKCAIDSKRRFGFMQNHSGEHIVSGIINKKYGFDNVGFHLGEDFVTLDFNGLLNREQLDEIEYEANQKISLNGSDLCQQIGKVHIISKILAVGVYILSQQGNFFTAVFNQGAAFCQNILFFTTAFPTTDIGDDAVSAEIIAAVHNRHPCLQGIIPHLWDAFCNRTGFVLNIELPLLIGQHIPENLRKLPQMVSRKATIHMGITFFDAVRNLGLPGHAST